MRVLATISGHGFGHLAQSALVLEALRARSPELELAVWSALTREVVAARLGTPFDYHHDADDFGLHMHDSLRIRFDESARHYQHLHRQLDAAVDARARLIERRRPEVVLCNVSYLALAAAARAGVPAVAMCSLNWANVWAHFFDRRRGARRIHRQMVDAYNSAAAFLLPEPSMPMPEIAAARHIGPLARTGKPNRQALERVIAHGSRIGLVTLRGADRLPVEQWPSNGGWHWLVPAEWGLRRADVHDIESACAASGMGFADLVACADVLIAKPGYGTFTEAACNRARVVYVRRPDWPEQDSLIPWLCQRVPCAELSVRRLRAGPPASILDALVDSPRREAVKPSGIRQAADELARHAA